MASIKEGVEEALKDLLAGSVLWRRICCVAVEGVLIFLVTALGLERALECL
jgi:hypothetical protein